MVPMPKPPIRLCLKVKFNELATYDKIKGLKLGDKDTDDSARFERCRSLSISWGTVS